MAAYLVAELEVTDPALFEDYRKRVQATIAAHGGRYLARGGALESLEGGWNPKRMVILEFPSLAQAKTWYGSPEYQELLKLRLRSSKGKVVLIEGV
ncbi:MAG: DUF1330 domain-containing protein [Nitrososphaera sp.]